MTDPKDHRIARLEYALRGILCGCRCKYREPWDCDSEARQGHQVTPCAYCEARRVLEEEPQLVGVP